ncbi:hypothetical protein [Pseudonocardia sp. D17]|uniref:hypothetical protein n=1 Tax=Pseudonocardia sp. D17 TaxID=882661 RepID=UPI002B3F3D65|nr:hypothetical protein PSD17_55660 [Pseudonocardia sp. D17]
MARPPNDAAEAEAAAWRRVEAEYERVAHAHERLAKALAEHRAAADRALMESSARAVEDAELVRNFRALLPFAMRRRRPCPPGLPSPRRPKD